MEHVQARVRLLAVLFPEALRGVSDALGALREPPLTPAEKERLYAAIETTVWDLPDAVFAGADEEGWEAEATHDAGLREALERAVEQVLSARAGAQ